MFASKQIWANIMPVKIFSDLVSFVGDPNGELKVKFDQHRQDELNRSLDSIERRNTSAEFAGLHPTKKDDKNQTFLPLVPTLPSMRIPASLKKSTMAKYDSV